MIFLIKVIVNLFAAMALAGVHVHAEAADDAVSGLDGCQEQPGQLKSIQPLLPAQVADRICKPTVPNRPLDALGPNCFAAAILWFNSAQPQVFVPGDEFGVFLKSFHEISEADLQRGDLVLFERKDLESDGQRYFQHAAVVINRDFVWNKLGPTKLTDRGNGAQVLDPPWTFSTRAALADEFDAATIVYFRKNIEPK